MRLAAITTSLLAAACSLQSEELATTSIECTTNDDGSTTCSEGEDRPGDEDTPPDPDGDLVCSGTGCVSECQYSDDSFHCSITCENGLRCESTCSEGSCQVSCDCPDGGGGGCRDQPTDECCQEHPEDPACNPGCPDGSEECSCEERPDDPECNPPQPCEDGSTDEECYCREHPEDPACHDGDPQPCPEDDPECCREGEDCQP